MKNSCFLVRFVVKYRRKQSPFPIGIDTCVLRTDKNKRATKGADGKYLFLFRKKIARPREKEKKSRKSGFYGEIVGHDRFPRGSEKAIRR